MAIWVPVALPNVAVEVAPDAAAPVLQFEPVSQAPLLEAVHVAFAASAAPGTVAHTVKPSSGRHERSARLARISSESPTRCSPGAPSASPLQLCCVCAFATSLCSSADATKMRFGDICDQSRLTGV